MEKIQKLGVRKEEGYLYFVDKDGDVSRTRMSRARIKGRKAPLEKVSVVRVKREKGYLYFLDSQGDISRSKMSRGRR